MAATIFAVTYRFDGNYDDLWCLDEVTVEEANYNVNHYLHFSYINNHGVHKKAHYSSFTNMIFGTEDFDLTIDDLEILIKFINLELWKNDEFIKKVNKNCAILVPDYIYSNILY